MTPSMTAGATTTTIASTDDITWQELENKINTWNNDIEQQATVFLKQVELKKTIEQLANNAITKGDAS